MHNCFMENWGNYLKSNYSDLSKMTKADLCEAEMIARAMKEIFKADKEYNIIEAMENAKDGEANIQTEMGWDEFATRFKDMYDKADAGTKIVMKTQIQKITG